MQKLLLLELNEVNFNFVQAYGLSGELPVLNGLIGRHGIQHTESEQDHQALEPWIQWVTAHTGLSYAEHGVFRLGDIVDHPEIEQIWEILAAAGITVGAFSPMNAANRSASTKIFVPDPWTRTTITGSAFVHKLAGAITQLVNENATGKTRALPYLWLAAGLARSGRLRSALDYLKLGASIGRKSWARALILDRLLADLFIGEVGKGLEFASLFLNAAAHIQHHYMFSSAAYSGPHRNPGWYVAQGADPLLDVYRLYDRIVGDVRRAFPQHRLLIATGLHQDPYPRECFYWRLKDHSAFCRKIGLVCDRVEPRMSRDFVVYCADDAQRLEARHKLETFTATDGEPLFRVDDRGGSLFVELTYPRDIGPELGFADSERSWLHLRDEVAFVAIKNGQHNGIGYLIDTRQDAIPETAVPLGSIFRRTLDHFGIAERADAAAERLAQQLSPAA